MSIKFDLTRSFIMDEKKYRTFVIRKDLDESLRRQAQAAGKTASRYIAELVEDHMNLNQHNLAKVTKIARALGVRPSRVVDNLLRRKLDEIEAKRKSNDPAALILDEVLTLGS